MTDDIWNTDPIRGEPIPVFYDRRQSVATQSFSPSSRKPALVVSDWEVEFGDKVAVYAFQPASVADLALAHDPDYVHGVLACEADNGFDNRDPAVAASLRYTVGSIVAAAKHAVQNRTAACSPTSGFHHAHYARAEGYCTFNGLMVAILKLKQLRLVEHVCILDMDQHYGNGTQDIIDRMGLDWVTHLTHTMGLLREPEQATRAGDIIHRAVGNLRERHGVHFFDLVVYQAGADAHVNDPLGGYLTTEQMQQRDFSVMRYCERYSLPLVWNLAGGYQQDKRGGIGRVLELHRNTMQQCINEFGPSE